MHLYAQQRRLTVGFLSRYRDDQIVKRVLKGRREDFAVLVDRYGSLLVAVAFAQVGNHADAEDVVQTAFMKAFTSLHTLRDQRQFGPWITTIARNEGKQYRRKAAFSRAACERANFETAVDEAGLEERDVRELLRQKVLELDEMPREVLLMHYFSGKSTREIADALGITQDAVKKRLERARATLGSRLADDLGEFLGPRKPDRERIKQTMAVIAGVPAPWLALPSSTGGAAITAITGGALIMSTNKFLATAVVIVLAIAAIGFYQFGTDNDAAPDRTEGAFQGPVAATKAGDTAADAESTRENTEVVESSLAEATPVDAVSQGIAGHVRDKESNAGIEGVKVIAKPAGGDEASEVTASTDASGAYALEGLPPGDFEVHRGDTPPPYREPNFVDRPVVITVLENMRHTVDFAVSREAPFSGVVIDSVGQPVPDAVVLLGGGIDTYVGTKETTDAEGRFRFSGLSPTGGLAVIARKDGLVSAQPEFELPPSGIEDMVIVLEAGAFISGTVVDTANRHLGDIRVLSHSIPSTRVGAAEDAFTDSNGEFTVGPLAAGTYRLMTRPKDERVSIGLDEGDRFDVAVGEKRTGVVLVLDRSSNISGRIMDESGVPIPDAQIWGSSGQAKSGADGFYLLPNLSPGVYHLQIHAAGYVQAMMNGVPAGSQDVNFVLRKSAYTISGRVVDANTGTPVPSFEVTWFTMDPLKTIGEFPMLSAGNLYDWNAFQNDTGDFELDVNWYVDWTTRAVVAARAPGYGIVMEVVDLEQVRPGNILLQLESGGRLEGIVTDGSGNPLEDTILFYERPLPGFTDRAAAVSDAQGRFVIENFPQNEQRLAFYRPGYAIAFEVVPAGRDLSQPLYVVLSGGHTLKGEIMAEGDTDEWNVQVTARGEYMPLSQTTVRAGAQFTLSNVPDGELSLVAHKRSENFRTVSLSRPIAVTGLATPVTMEVPSGDSLLEGQIDLGGRSPATLRITVRYDLSVGELTHMALGRWDGAYDLQGLPAGAASIEVEATMQDGQVYKETQAVNLEPGQVTQSDFVVPQ